MMYAFMCRKCQKVFELIMPVHLWDKKRKCKYCKSQLKRIITPVRIIRYASN